MVHLVDDKVGGRLHHGTLVTAPVVGIGLCHVDDGSTLAVDAYGLGKYTGTLTETHVESIELTHEVTTDSGRPLFVTRALHLYGLEDLATQSLLIDTEGDLLRVIGGEK